MKKTDYKKELKELYGPSAKEPSMIKVPEMNYLMIDGKGDPSTSKEYVDSVEALYPVAYTLKFMIKKQGELDYVVPPLEGLWWADDMSAFVAGKRDSWRWTTMIMQPPPVTRDSFEKAVELAKKKKDLAALPKMRLEALNEGLCAQIMHIGPYSAEGPTIERLHAFIKEKGFALRGKHHEIYLSDPRKSELGKLKTVIRQPVE